MYVHTHIFINVYSYMTDHRIINYYVEFSQLSFLYNCNKRLVDKGNKILIDAEFSEGI